MAPFVDLKEKNGITSGAPGSFSVGRNVGIDISLADPGTSEMDVRETRSQTSRITVSINFIQQLW